MFLITAPCPKYQWLLDDLYASPVITDLVVANQEIITEFVTNANLTTFPSIPDLAKFYDALIQEVVTKDKTKFVGESKL